MVSLSHSNFELVVILMCNTKQYSHTEVRLFLIISPYTHNMIAEYNKKQCSLFSSDSNKYSVFKGVYH
jgi:hypothetical protein